VLFDISVIKELNEMNELVWFVLAMVKQLAGKTSSQSWRLAPQKPDEVTRAV